MSVAHLQFDAVSKRFGGVLAVDQLSLSIRRGECHALVGENGAGKSTAGKMLAGIHQPDAGCLRIHGTITRLHSPADAARRGIGMVHQELAFCPDLSVAENLCLGRYPRRWGMLVNRRAMADRAAAMLRQVGASLDVQQPMRRLSTAQEQLVQIAAAVGAGANLLIFDEPTSSLSNAESQRLFELIRRLRAEAVTIIYISHRMSEVFDLCDRISVLRDGRLVGTVDRTEATEPSVVRMMIGRSLADYFPQHLEAQPGPVALEVGGLTSPGVFQDVSFEVRAGEVVGLAGLVGAGRSELAQAIFGLDSAARGTVRIGGQNLTLGSVPQAMHRGLGYVPEDRKRQGLVSMLSCRENISLAMLDRLGRGGLLRRRLERREAQAVFTRLDVRAPSLETPVSSLSGGNQQKIVLGRWLARKLKVLIVDEPTRGVDIGAKAAIHALIDDLTRQGLAVLLISSELPEVLNLSTRILVMRRGRLVGQLSREEASQEKLLTMMADITASALA